MGGILESLKKDLLRMQTILSGISDKQNLLYEAAFDAYREGRDLSRIAPDLLGCAESVSRLIQEALPEMNFPMFLSTTEMFNYFEQSPTFVPVSEEDIDFALIVISPTDGNNVGHVGILGKKNAPDGTKYILSNNSYTGMFTPDYSIASWKRFYAQRKGLPVLFYRIV